MDAYCENALKKLELHWFNRKKHEKEKSMKKQGILKIFAGMMLIATTTACGSSSAGVKNVDLKDPDGDYHVQVDFKTNEVTLS